MNRETRADPYDELPYTDHAYAESHPDRLAVVALLSGFDPPAVERARVLDLGCGRGGNLLPMAAALPRATLVGVDRSARQIAEARRISGACGLSNVTFHAASFEEIELAPASFDFVISHGVYSWVPVATRRALLHSVARWLAPGGIAYVSFNTLPGWYGRLAARDWLRFAAARTGLAAHELPASLAWLRARVSPAEDAYGRELDRVRQRLAETDPAYLVHEYLEDEHHPELVTTFLREVDDAGLRYLGDAIPSETSLELLDDEARARAYGMDAAATQQLVDFVRATSFRRALLVRADTCEDRGWEWSAGLSPRALDRLRVASRLRPSSDSRSSEALEQFDGPDGSVHVGGRGARWALRELAREAPRSLPFADLAGRVAAALAPDEVSSAAALRSELFELWLATGAVDLHVYEPAFVTSLTARPEACAVARWHAAHGGALTNRWHQEVLLAEDVVRFVLARLDGTRAVDDVARELERAGTLPAAAAASDVVRASLELLARSALIVSSR